MRTTRRSVMVGGLAGMISAPTLAANARWRWRHGERSVLLFDPTLDIGHRFANAGRAAGGPVLRLEGDSVRLAQAVLEERPALVAGVSRHAEALLFEEVANEAGYVRVALLEGTNSGCATSDCRPGWTALGQMARRAGVYWVDALAAYAVRPESSEVKPLSQKPRTARHRAFAWMLARAI